MSLIMASDGRYQAVRTDDNGHRVYMDVDDKDITQMVKEDKITYMYRDEEGNTYNTEPIDIEDADVLREVKTHIVKVQKDDDILSLERRMKELEESGTLQDQKDKASLKIQKDGGGVVRLRDYNKGIEGEDYKGDKRLVLQLLYAKAKKGDSFAKRKIEQLWNLVIPALKTQKEPFHLYECPRCSQAVEGDEDECIFCGWSKSESGYKRYGDLR